MADFNRLKSKIRPIELIVSILVLGLVTLVAVPLFDTVKHKSKTTEAVVHVDRMFQGAVSIFNSYSGDNPWDLPIAHYLPPDQEWTPPLGRCGYSGCNKGDNQTASSVYFYESKTWIALGFKIEEPFFYSYQFKSCEISPPDVDELKNTKKKALYSYLSPGKNGGWSCKEDTRISCEASGDLDGDGTYSLFKRGGLITHNSDGILELKPDPTGIIKRDPLE